MIELRAGDVRTRYARVAPDPDVDAAVSDLAGRFQRRERQEIERLQQVVDLVECNGCQVNALVGHFGEIRNEPCGHCTWCLTKQRQRLSPPRAEGIRLDESEVLALYRRCPRELQTPRQIAKILCGLGSPSFTKLRMNREALFGVLEAHRFAEVVAWTDSLLPNRGVPAEG